jgi:hypothetical protein
MGCGGNFLSGISDDPTPIPTVRFEISAVDGPLIKARVRLVSLLEGTLATQTSDRHGRATLSLPRSKFLALSDQDLLYIYVDSLASLGTSVEPQNKVTRILQEGQLRLKSFLPPVAQIKKLSSDLLTSNPDIARAGVVSHFSNAKALLAEANLKSLGILKASLRPESRVSATDIPLISSNVSTVESAIFAGNENLTAKFKLVAMATKALVENNITKFLSGASQTEIESSDEILLELAGNGSDSGSTLSLNSSFQQSLEDLSEAISEDLKSEEISATFTDSAALTVIEDLTVTKVEAAVEKDVIGQVQSLVLSRTASFSELSNLSLVGSSGDIKLSFDTSTPAGLGVSLEFAYSLNGGQNFTRSIRTTPSLSSLPLQTATSFIWHSFQDFQTDQTAVNLRLNLSLGGSPIETLELENLSILNLPNRIPVAENLTVSGTSGNISIGFDLIDLDQDSVSMLFEFSTAGAQIFTASTQTTPSLASLNPPTATSFLWHSSQDFLEDETVVVRLTPSDPESTGASLISTPFQVFNLPNFQPSISNLSLSGETEALEISGTPFTVFRRDILVSFDTEDQNQDPLDILFEISLDSGSSWTRSTHTNILLSSLPSGGKTTFLWETFKEFQIDQNGVQIRLTPSDSLSQGITVTSVPFLVFNFINTKPRVQNISISGNAADLLVIVDLSDDEEDDLSLSFEYSIDGGQVYFPSSDTTPSLVSLSLSPTTNTSFVWHSSVDITTDETAVRLRLIPSDGKLFGTTLISSIIEVLNQPNFTPSLENLTLSSGSGNIPITVDLVDADNEPLSLGFEFSIDSGLTWTTSVNSSLPLTELTPATGFGFNWLSSLEFQSDETGVKIRLTPSDSQSTGSALTSTLFSVSNFVNSTSIVSQVSVTGTSGELSVGFLAEDSDAQTLLLTFEYSLDTGQSWVKSTNTTPSLSSLTSPYITSFTWNSALDITTDEASVLIRLTPFDGINAGIAGTSSNFSVLNFVNSSPTVSINSTTGTSGDILIGIQATDSNSDTLKLSFEFSLDSGSSWVISTHTTPSLTSLGYPYLTTFSWHSLLDTTSDTTQAQIRLTAFDGTDTGSSLASSNFTLLNLATTGPLLSHLIISGNRGDISIGVDLSDPESHPINLLLEFSLDAGSSFTSTLNLTPSFSGLGEETGATFIWDSSVDFSTDETLVSIRLTAFDTRAIGSILTPPPFSILNAPNSTPTASNLATIGTSGDILVSVNLVDTESDPINLLLEYSTNAGASWDNTIKTSPTLEGFTPVSLTTFLWHSSQDFSRNESAVKLRLTPSDYKGDGFSIESELFSVSNNSIPRLQNLTLTDTGPGDLSFSVDLIDLNTDVVSLSFAYTTDSEVTWISSTHTSLIQSNPPATALPFTWYSTHDFLTDQPQVQISLTPSDGQDTGTSAVLGPFSVLNFPNTSPRVENLTALGASGAIVFDFTLSDDESDPVSLSLEYSLDQGTSWSFSQNTLPSITQALTLPFSRLIWQSGLDFQTITSNLSIRLTPSDTKTIGLTGTLSLTSVNNIPNYPTTSALAARTRLVPEFRMDQLVPFNYQNPGQTQILVLNRDIDTSALASLNPIAWTEGQEATILAQSSTYDPGKFTVFKNLTLEDMQELRSVVKSYVGTDVPDPTSLQTLFPVFVQRIAPLGKLEYSFATSPSISFETSQLCTNSSLCDSIVISQYFQAYTSSTPYTFFFMPSLSMARSDGLTDYAGNLLSGAIQGYYPTTMPMVDLFPFGPGSMRQLHSPTQSFFDFDSSGNLYIPTSAYKSDVKSIPITLMTNFDGIALPDSNALTQSLTNTFYTPAQQTIPTSQVPAFSQIVFADGNAKPKSVLNFLKATNGALFLHGFANQGEDRYRQPYTTIQDPSQNPLNLMRIIFLSSNDVQLPNPPFNDTFLFVGDSLSFSAIETYVSVSGSGSVTRFQQRDVHEIITQYYKTLSVTFGSTTTLFVDVLEVTRYESVFPVINITGTSTFSIDPSTNATVGELHKVTNLFGRHAGVIVVEEVTHHNTGGQSPVLEKRENREVIGALDIIGGHGWNKAVLPQ